MTGALQRLRRLEEELYACGDRQAVFAAAYVEVMSSLQRDLAAGCFDDPGWVRRCAARFADYYFEALRLAEQQPGSVPRAWWLALRPDRRREGAILSNLVLSMNAHINHDLPLAIAETLPRGEVSVQAGDYARIMETLSGCIAPIQARVAQRYSVGLGRMDRAAMGLDDRLTAWLIQTFRAQGWGLALSLRTTPRRRAALRSELDHRACLCARVLRLPTRSERLTATFRWLEAPLLLPVRGSPEPRRAPPRSVSQG